MPSDTNHIQERCWIDVFAEKTFGGRRVRISTAPTGRRQPKIEDLPSIGSVIVGPGAIVILANKEGSKRSYRVLMPGSVIPEIEEGELSAFN